MSAVIDVSALLCVLCDERGAEQVVPILRGGLLSAINLSESCSRGRERGVPFASVQRSVRRFEMTVVPFDYDQAIATAVLREPTRPLGASLGDRAFLALGRLRGVPVYTADTRLGRIDAALGIDVRLVR